MKKVLILVCLSLLAMVSAFRNRHRSRSRKMDLSFSTELESESKEKPSVMESIFRGKPTGVSAKYSVLGEENNKAEQKPVAEQRFKENSENELNNYKMKDLESPRIVKSLGSPAPFNIPDRVAARSDQTMTNREAYDLIYDTHEDYYNDKRFIVFDRHFRETEDFLLNKLKASIDGAIDYSKYRDMEHIENFDKNKINLRGLDVQTGAPFIHPDAVATSMKYDKIEVNDKDLQITSSDPYNTIFGGYIK